VRTTDLVQAQRHSATDDCSSEFSSLTSDQDDFEMAVSEYQSEAVEELTRVERKAGEALN
jgi:hypothetical protein